MNGQGILIAAAFGILTGLGGFLVGQGRSGGVEGRGEVDKKSSATLAASRSDGLSRGGRKPDVRGYELSQNPREGLKVLIDELKGSPMAQMDFEALFNIYDMVRYLDAYELEGLVADLEEMGNAQEMVAVHMMLLNRWAAKDGPKAMEAALEGKGMMKMVAGMGAMMGWMRSEPEQAYEWFQENGDRLGSGMGMGKNQFEAMYYAAKAKTDFEGTLGKLGEMDAGLKTAVIQQLAQSIGSDAEKRDELIASLRESGDQVGLKQARTAIVGQIAWQDPQAALAFIEGEGVDGEQKRELTQTVTSMWGYSDPAGALDYVVTQVGAEGEGMEQVSQSFGNWVKQDEAQASAWLQQQGESMQTDGVFESAGRQLMWSEQNDRAAEWYAQILDEETRHRQYEKLYREWSKDDQEAADAWKSGLPEEDLAAWAERTEPAARDGFSGEGRDLEAVGEAIEELKNLEVEESP
ncbi:MAG: hypothetical protein AAGC74_06280 [Verrucomicrobiota bacterium]